jgi:hypothetical protein
MQLRQETTDSRIVAAIHTTTNLDSQRSFHAQVHAGREETSDGRLILKAANLQAYRVMMKTALKAATRGPQDSAKIAKIREILERAKREIEGLEKAA